MKSLKKLLKHKKLIIFGSIIFVVLFIASFFGFVPILSSLTGFDHAKDLGIKYTEQDLKNVNEKTQIKYFESAKSLELSGAREVNVEFTSEELTAQVADHVKRWRDYPVKDFQIKINDDDTLEVSGVINLDVLNAYASETNMPDEYKKQIMARLKMFNANPKFYAKTTFNIKDGHSSGKIMELQIGNIKMPKEILENQNSVASFVDERIRAAGIDAKDAHIENGKLVFEGTIPEKIGFGK